MQIQRSGSALVPSFAFDRTAFNFVNIEKASVIDEMQHTVAVRIPWWWKHG
jgi:hypothetical protein